MFTLELFPYQEEAVNRMVDRGSILVAFEMGLGKTILAIAAIEDLMGQDLVSTAVLVVPAGLKWQWARAIAAATDVHTRQVTMRGAGGTRSDITVPTEEYCIVVGAAKENSRQRAAQYRKIQATRPDYVIIGYENVVNDWSHVRKLRPELIVLDEATAIKTFAAQRTRKIKRFTAPFRLALSGQPVENAPEELFSIMQWVDPDVLGRFDLFDRAFIVRNSFGGVISYRNLPLFHTKMAEAMVRKTRRDPDVSPYLPDVVRTELYATLDPASSALYNAIASDLLSQLRSTDFATTFDVARHYSGQVLGGGDDYSAQGKIMSRYQALTMLCDHPGLITASAKAYESSMEQQAAGASRKLWPGSSYCHNLWVEGYLDGVEGTPKLDAVCTEVDRILAAAPDNKIIVFSFYRAMLTYLETRLAGWGTVQYHGGMSSHEKAANEARFKSDADVRIFLTSDSGAYGVDLPEATHVVDYDLPWSAGVLAQRDARHVRAGSSHATVHVTHVVVRDSIEERQLQVVQLKARVSLSIMDNEATDDSGEIANDVPTLTRWLETHEL